MRHYYLVPTFIAIFFCVPASAVELWGDTHAGMTVEEVQTIFPGAAKPDNDRPRLPNADMRLTVAGIDLVSQQFEAEFYFDSAGLVQVALHSNTIEKSREVKKACAALKGEITQGYGTAIVDREVKSSNGKDQYAVYKQEELVVKLWCNKKFGVIRIVYQSQDYLRAFEPFGLRAGMSIEELTAWMPEPPVMEENSLHESDASSDVVLVALLKDVPIRPAGEGKLTFEIRASKRHGLCFVNAILNIPVTKDFSYLFEGASVEPARDLFGGPSVLGGFSAPFKFSIVPLSSPNFSSEAWLATETEPLPGSIDTVVYMWMTKNVDGEKIYVAGVRYLFSNMESCGLTRKSLKIAD